MKRKVTKIAALILVITVVISCFAGCGAKSGVSSMLSKFEKSCQTLDVEGMMDCINPSIITPVRTVLNLFGVSDLNGAISSIIEVIGLIDFQGNSPEDILKTFKISPKDYSFNDDKTSCEVSTELSYVLGSERKTATVTIKCILVNDEWYINGIGR